MNSGMTLSAAEQQEILRVLKIRFEKNMQRHPGLVWDDIQRRLEAGPQKLWSLSAMEGTGGEPDVIGLDENSGAFLFCDCSAESPAGRRNLCYDRQALDDRKEFKPGGSALEMAEELGIELLNEEEYMLFQQSGPYDLKTSSWLATPEAVRKKGGALFGDHRYGRTFIYHNGAQSYYAVRGFRGMLKA